MEIRVGKNSYGTINRTSNQNNKLLYRRKFPKGVLSKGQILTLYFDSVGSGGIALLEVKIYKDGVYETPPASLVVVKGFAHYAEIAHVYNYDCEYVIEVYSKIASTSNSVTLKNLDFSPARTIMRGDWVEGIEYVDKDSSSITGSGARTKLGTFNFSKTFIDVPKVEIITSNYWINVGVADKTTTTCTYNFAHLDDVTWTATVYFDWVARGPIASPVIL